MQRRIREVARAAFVVCVLWVGASNAEDESPSLKVYGFAMTDQGYNFGTINPDWYDVVRPTKLPAFSGEFGKDGRLFFGVRQSRLGVKAGAPTPLGALKVHLEAELFGVGKDAGQTTFRLRHAFGELGHFGAGQTWSGFMDPDVFPNSIEYWGPSGMVLFRNVQMRWQPLQGDHEVQFTVENPGGSADLDSYAGRLELEGVSSRFPAPDVTAHYRGSGRWGHVQVAGILRYLTWDDLGTDSLDLSGSTVGWGVNLSSNLNLWKEDVVLKLQAVYGSAIQNYMNDASVDIAVQPGPNASRPLEGVGLRSLGTVAFVDVAWNKYFTSTFGHSFVRIFNSSGQAASAYRMGQYALANVLVHPTEDFLLGPELQWGQRRNFSDGYVYNDFRVQFSMKYSFEHQLLKKN